MKLDEGRLGEAEGDAGQAAAEFQREKEEEEEAAATIVLADCLLRQGKSSEAQSAMERVRELTPKIEDRDARLFVAITTARLRGLAGDADAAVRELRSHLARSEKVRLSGLSVPGRLALGGVAVKTGKFDEGHAALKALAGGRQPKVLGQL